MQAIHPGSDLLEQQDKFAPNYPEIAFLEMYRKDKLLYPSGGFNPLHLKIVLVRKNLAVANLALEMALPPVPFDFKGAKFLSYGFEGQGGRVFSSDSSVPEHTAGLHTGLEWLTLGFTLLGDSALFSGNVITLNTVGAEVYFLLLSSSGIIDRPIFRLRRTFATSVTAAVLGVGNGTKTEFAFTLPVVGKLPVCPGSVKINFTDSGGAKVGKIRDNGKGILTTVPPAALLGVVKKSTLDYKTGDIVLVFSGDHVPTATNITIDYEHAAGGEPDSAEYRVDWRIEA